MLQITDDDIKKIASHKLAYENGINLMDNVKSIEYIKYDNAISGVVAGADNYFTFVKLRSNGTVYSFNCQCDEFFHSNGACRHIVALLFRAKQKYGQTDAKKTLTDVLIPFSFTKNVRKYIPLRLWIEQTIASQDRDSVYLEVKMKVGENKPYVIRDVKAFLEAVNESRTMYFTKKYEIDFRHAYFEGVSKKVIDFLVETLNKEKLQQKYMTPRYYSYSYYNDYSLSIFEKNTVKLYEDNLKNYLEIIKDAETPINCNGIDHESLKIVNDIDLSIDIEEKDNNLIMKADYDENTKIMALTQDFEYAIDPYRAVIYRIPPEKRSLIENVHKARSERKKPLYKIAKEDQTHFLKRFVPGLESSCHVNINPELTKKVLEQTLETKIYFDATQKGVVAKVEFCYGENVIRPGMPDNEINLMFRDNEKENEILELMKASGMHQRGEYFFCETDGDIVELLTEKMDKLKEAAEVYYSEAFKALNIRNVNSVRMGVRLNSDSNLLEFDFQVDDFGDDDLIKLLESVKEKKKYYRLKNGSIIKLDNRELLDLSELFSDLDINDKKIKNSKINLPANRALFLDNYLEEKEFKAVVKNEDYEKLVSEILNPKDLKIKLDKDLNKILRDYQKFGFKWMKTLAHYGFGGILADDMGLGKTLQVLSFIKSEKAENGKPSLVVAPTSLIFNWKAEVDKFVPDLKVTVIAGTKGERDSLIEEMEKYDIVVTSYGALKRDIEQYEKREFSYIFVDEAQHIKNPATLNAGSVKSLNSKGCFAMTGTPIENTLTELWSVFDFIMPGYLMSHQKFIKKFETPIVRNSDKEALMKLSRFIKPFVLRRLKKDVLKELPEKIESKVIAEMTSEQKKLYAAYLKKAQGEVAAEIKNNGIEKSKIKILAVLTRLRQLCCHPSTFIEEYKGGSGKLETLMELLEGSIQSGHRILIFSQFTSMLKIIGKELNKLNISFFYLDGSTPAEDRMSMVNDFNSLERPVFLISLKAGGTGLNLTAADIVIHYDPWWNPSVEDQATDRAYRIGQTKAVQVFKIVAKGTIEERILELQEKKKDLINSVIHAGENLVTKLSEKEIRELFQMEL
ncbi:MAG: DEAD/DEAH box helicase [Bacillota bacterium]|nr:DEAD/DEAH box helicase [Bacillota bacterium]